MALSNGARQLNSRARVCGQRHERLAVFDYKRLHSSRTETRGNSRGVLAEEGAAGVHIIPFNRALRLHIYCCDTASTPSKHHGTLTPIIGSHTGHPSLGRPPLILLDQLPALFYSAL